MPDSLALMLLLIAAFIVVPILELWVILEIGGSIGVGPTIFLLIFDSVLGAALLRSQGRGAWVAFNRALSERRMPAKEVLDGALIIVGGALLLTPGFITDAVGLALLIPPARAVFRGLTNRLVLSRFTAGPRAAMWGYGRMRDRRAGPDGREAPEAEGGREPRPEPGVFGDFDWTGRPERRPDDIEGTAHEVPDDEGLPPGEDRGSFPG